MLDEIIYSVPKELKCGRPYHLKWANAGAVWILHSLDTIAGTCIMYTPKTNRRLVARISDLRNTIKNTNK